MDSHAQHALGVANARPPAVCACVSARARLHLFAKANFHARWQGRDSEIGETARATGRERERARAGMRVGEREWEGGGELRWGERGSLEHCPNTGMTGRKRHIEASTCPPARSPGSGASPWPTATPRLAPPPPLPRASSRPQREAGPPAAAPPRPAAPGGSDPSRARAAVRQQPRSPPP